jgi:type IV pilus biogenesis protein CpaD/CtpE
MIGGNMKRRIALLLIVLGLLVACASNPMAPVIPTDGEQRNPPTILQETLDVAPDSLSNGRL